MIYLDNAATTFPKPSCVISEMTRAQSLYGANPGRGGHFLTMKAGKKIYLCRSALAEFFSASEERVIFTNNCTTALNMAIKGSVKKGDHILISSLEHNSVLRPVHKLSQQGIVSYDVFEVNPLSDEETFRNFIKLVNEDTALVVCTAVSNVFGTVLPFVKIGSFCRTRKIRFILDGAQAAGSHRINLTEMPVDILCLPGHKGLLGPMGTGVLILSENTDIDSFCEGGTGSNSLYENQPDFYPDKLESGTVNLPGIAGLYEGIRYIKDYGGEYAILQKERSLIELLREDLSVMKNVRIYDEMLSQRLSNVLSINISDFHSEQVAQHLDKAGIAVRAGYHCSYLAHKTYGTEEKGTVRISTGIFNTKKDVKTLSFCLNKIAMGKKM